MGILNWNRVKKENDIFFIGKGYMKCTRYSYYTSKNEHYAVYVTNKRKYYWYRDIFVDTPLYIHKALERAYNF